MELLGKDLHRVYEGACTLVNNETLTFGTSRAVRKIVKALKDDATTYVEELLKVQAAFVPRDRDGNPIFMDDKTKSFIPTDAAKLKVEMDLLENEKYTVNIPTLSDDMFENVVGVTAKTLELLEPVWKD